MRDKSYKILKVYFAFIFIVILFSGGIINAQTATAPSGSGTSGDPYLIATLDNLYWVTQNSSSWNKYFLQTADIDASSTSTWDGGAGFSPIGNSSTKFTGAYDGGMHTITGLFINRSTTNYVGMFGDTDNWFAGGIKNIGLINVDITGQTYVGGLVGSHYGNISNSYSNGSVSGSGNVGGLVGANSFRISSSYSNGSVSGSDFVGGLVGHNWDRISGSYSNSSVSGGSSIGGLVGRNRDDIWDCYSTGSVNGNTNVGGLVGYNYISGDIRNSFSLGAVSGTIRIGGFVGWNDYLIRDSFWDTQTSGLGNAVGAGDSDGVTRKTTAEMKTLSTFTDAGWDFEVETTNGTDNYWDIDNVNQSINNGYPFLSWQNGASTSVSPGDNIAGAFNLGDFQVGASNQRKYVSDNTSSYTSQHSTSPGNDVFYKFNIIDDATDPGKIGFYVRTSSAAFNSVIYLLDDSGNQVAVNDGSGNNSIIADYSGTFPAGTYYVVVDGSSAAQAGSFALTVEVIKKVVAAKFTANPEIGCSTPHTVFFTDQSTNPDIWLWSFGDGGSSTAKNPIHTYTTSGTFVVTLEIQDTMLYGAKSTFTDTIFVSNPIADFSGSPLFGCGPLTVNFTDTSVDAVGWEWTFGDGDTSTAQNPTHIYSTPGTYTVTLKVTSSLGCTNTKTRTSYVQVIGPTVDFGITSTSGSVPLSVSFKDLSTSGSPIVTWYWDFGDGATSTAQNPTHIYNTAGMYNVSLTVQDLDGCPRTLTKNNFVNTPPLINSIVRQSPTTSPTRADQLAWDVTFSEMVVNLDSSDFSVTGATGSVISAADQGGNVYRITVSGGDLATLNGTVILDFAVGQDVKDSAGNALTNTTPTGTNNNTFILDNALPTVTISTTEPGTTRESRFQVNIMFSEAVLGFLISDITVANATLSHFSGSGASYSVYVSPSVSGFVTVDVNAGVAQDFSGNDNTAAETFSIIYNVLPFIGSIGSTAITYKEGDPAVQVSSAINISDEDDNNLTGAKVEITNNYNPDEDLITYNDPTDGQIKATYDAYYGVIKLSGVASISLYESALRSITYQNTNTINPDEKPRSVIFVVSDDEGNSNIVSRTIRVKRVNDAPIVSELPMISFKEDSSAVVLFSNLENFVTDPDDSLHTFVLSNADGVIRIENDGSQARFSAPENWFGEEIITVKVSDGDTITTSTLTVKVIPVNDPPVINDLPSEIYLVDGDKKIINLWPFVYDIESPDSLLSVTVDGGGKSIISSYDAENGNLTVSSALGFSGEINVEITVSDPDGGSTSTGFEISVSVEVTGINDLSGIPTDYEVTQNYPNPFNPTTTIKYGLPEDSHVTIMIYNILGEQIKILTDEVKRAGYHESIFDASRLTSGLYIYMINSESMQSQRTNKVVKKMLLVK